MMKAKLSVMKSFTRDQSGVTIVEAALVMPLYFMLILGILGWGLVLWESNALQYAAERSARCSVLPQDLQGNRQCIDWSNTEGNWINWIPMVNTAAITPNTTTVTTSQPSTTRTFQSTRTGTAESYNVNCITVTVTNPFLPGIAGLPQALRQNYCRPAST